MARVDEYLGFLDDPSGPGLTLGHPADEALLALLICVAYSDGEVQDHELVFLGKVLPGRDADELRAWVETAGSKPIDFEAVAQALPTTEERWKGLRFAARMAWKDGVLAVQESAVLAELAHALELPAGAVGRIVAEMQGRVEKRISVPRIAEALDGMTWAVDVEPMPLQGPLTAVLPEDAYAVARVCVDGAEILGLYEQGVAGRFREGDVFLQWDHIVAYTRVPVLGAAGQIHTESGERWTVVDARLGAIGLLFDRLFYVGVDGQGSEPPVVEVIRGD